jgi:hypothetical protein
MCAAFARQPFQRSLLCAAAALAIFGRPVGAQASGATLRQTLAWLKEQIDEYAGREQGGDGWSYSESMKLVASNGCIVILEKDYEGHSHTVQSKRHTSTRVNLRLLTTDVTTDEKAVYLRSGSDARAIVSRTTDSPPDSGTNGQSEGAQEKLRIYFLKNVALVPRVAGAFQHAINLCGGRTVTEPF